MKNKSTSVYEYEERAEYNKKMKIGGKKFRCFSKDKLQELFPRGGYSFVGEIYADNQDDQAGSLKFNDETSLPICVVRGNHDKAMIDAGYIQVADRKFIAVMKKAPSKALWISMILGAIAVATVGTLLIVHYINKKPIDPEQPDPYIRPIESTVITVSGTVTSGGYAVENTEVTILKGDTIVATTTTDSKGKYLFSRIANGVYTIRVKNGTQTTISALIVDNLSVKKDFAMTDSTLNVKIEFGNINTPAVAVNGLFEIAKNYTYQDKRVDVTLVAKKLEESDVSLADQTLIKGKSGSTTLTYFDFALYRETFTGGVGEGRVAISEVDTPIEIILPYDTSRDIETYVFRNHDSTCQKFTKLTEYPTSNYQDGTYYVTRDYIYIYSKYFSTYAIGSADAGRETKGVDIITYSNVVYVNKTTGNIFTEGDKLIYRHDSDSTHNARVELYLVGNNGSLYIATSGIIPPGNELYRMRLLSGVSGMPSVGTYSGLMKIVYLDGEGETSTNVDVPMTVVIEQ